MAVGVGTVLAVACALAAVAMAVHLVRHLVGRPQRSMRDEVVLLTGAGGGLGRQMALELAKRGCPLALVDIARLPNEETAKQVRDAAPHLPVSTYTVDLASREEIAGLLGRVFRDFGRIDILLSNAAILNGGAVCDYRDEDVDNILAVNLRATILLVRGVLPHMRARRSGQIVAVSSAAGVIPNHAMSLYGASKAGLTHFMQCLHREMRMDGIEKDIIITTIIPYFMSTFDLIVNASHVTGCLSWLTPFVEASWAAQRAVESIARGDSYVFIPNYTKMGTLLTTLLPQCLQNILTEKALSLTFKYLPSYEYRHAKRDFHMLHDFLSRGFEPFADPAPLLQAMSEECRVNGVDVPYDFTIFRDSLQQYYSTRGKKIPDIVHKFIEKDC